MILVTFINDPFSFTFGKILLFPQVNVYSEMGQLSVYIFIDNFFFDKYEKLVQLMNHYLYAA